MQTTCSTLASSRLPTGTCRRRSGRLHGPPGGGERNGEVPVDQQPRAWLFSGWNWVAKQLPRAMAAHERAAVVAFRQHQRAVRGHDIVAVHEIEGLALRLASRRPERRAGLREPHGVPAHVRHLEVRRQAETHDPAGEDAEPGRAPAFLRDARTAPAARGRRPGRAGRRRSSRARRRRSRSPAANATQSTQRPRARQHDARRPHAPAPPASRTMRTSRARRLARPW